MNASPAGNALLQIATSTPPNSIDEVILLMENLDKALAPNDGLRWFNLLYLKVTQHVRDSLRKPAGRTRLGLRGLT